MGVVVEIRIIIMTRIMEMVEVEILEDQVKVGSKAVLI